MKNTDAIIGVLKIGSISILFESNFCLFTL